MQNPRSLALLTLLVLGLAVASRLADCQEPADSVMVARYTPRWTIGAIGVQLGAAHLGLGELNGTLTANGRPAFSTDIATFGLAASARFGRIALGGSSESALPQRASAAGWVNRISFGSATLDAGYVVLDGARFVVQPQLSLGVRYSSMRLEQRGDLAYEDGVRDPARSLDMTTMHAMAGVGIAAELRLSTRTTGAFAIGIRAGITRPLGSPAAWSGERAVTGAPRESDGRYLRLAVSRPIGRRREIVSTLSTAMFSLLAQ